MVRMTREERRAHNRFLLITAAERIFASKGVEGASLDDVATEAELTKGAVYSNFRSKGELILEVIRYRQNDSGEAREFQDVLSGSSDDFARLEAWCDGWVAAAKSGERTAYIRLLFNFLPYALKDPELTSQFAALLKPDEDAAARSPIPSGSAFSQIPAVDQFRILTALDIGLAALMMFEGDEVRPELYKTAVLALARTAPVGTQPLDDVDESQDGGEEPVERYEEFREDADD
jgi:AcrR family transcriptional regulator